MKSQQFNFNRLVQHVHNQMNGEVSTSDLEELLLITEDAYQKDSPISVGKSLTIVSLEFKGKKLLSETAYPIHYNRQFSKGVSLWVGDNLVGKSSIFKIVKLALTGRNSIAKDVDSWLTEILLEFQVGSKIYTVVIKKENSSTYKFSLENAEKNILTKNVERDSSLTLYEGGMGKFEDYMQAFFFRELNYYALQWTQNSSHRENPQLLTSNTSWATYYKSVFLEAEDYNVLFWGQQAELIVQMLLGLELTFPLNRIKIKREHLLYRLGISKLADNNTYQTIEQNNENVEKQLSQVNFELQELTNKAKLANATKRTDNGDRLEDARQKFRDAINQRQRLENELYSLNGSLNLLQRKNSSLIGKISDYKVDILKKDRAINDLTDYLQLGSFFNSLEVKTCPNCDHTVKKEKITNEKVNGSCRLCDYELSPNKAENESFDYQVEQLSEQREQLNKDLQQLKESYADNEKQFAKCKDKIKEVESAVDKIPFSTLQQEIDKALGEVTNRPLPYDWEYHIQRVTELTTIRAKLEQQLSAVKPNLIPNNEKRLIELQIKALEICEIELKRQRTIKSSEPIRKLEQLYIDQLHAFGLPHYEKVEVRENFKVSYFMHGREFSFDEISPGEKLRAKLGLYISLIEMDVVHQLGHHPRFIVLDSPAKEEGDRIYVEGLKTTLAYIESKFGAELQIFIGTAQRDLVDTVNVSKVEVREEKQFFF